MRREDEVVPAKHQSEGQEGEGEEPVLRRTVAHSNGRRKHALREGIGEFRANDLHFDFPAGTRRKLRGQREGHALCPAGVVGNYDEQRTLGFRGIRRKARRLARSCVCPVCAPSASFSSPIR